MERSLFFDMGKITPYRGTQLELFAMDCTLRDLRSQLSAIPGFTHFRVSVARDDTITITVFRRRRPRLMVSGNELLTLISQLMDQQ